MSGAERPVEWLRCLTVWGQSAAQPRAACSQYNTCLSKENGPRHEASPGRPGRRTEKGGRETEKETEREKRKKGQMRGITVTEAK